MSVSYHPKTEFAWSCYFVFNKKTINKNLIFLNINQQTLSRPCFTLISGICMNITHTLLMPETERHEGREATTDMLIILLQTCRVRTCVWQPPLSDASMWHAPASGSFYQTLNCTTRTHCFRGRVKHSRTLAYDYSTIKCWLLGHRAEFLKQQAKYQVVTKSLCKN
jgi:hypothetical protein